MNHFISEEEINIEWDRTQLIDNHGSGCSEWIVEGEGSDGKKYTGTCQYQSDQLISVDEIELL